MPQQTDCKSCEMLKQRIVVLEQLVTLHQVDLSRRRRFETDTETLVLQANELQKQLDALEEVSDDGDVSDGPSLPGE